MRENRSSIAFIQIAIAVALVFSVFGCKLMKKTSKPAEEEATVESLPVRLIGCQESLTVNTTPEELVKYLAEMTWWPLKNVKIGKLAIEENGLPKLGSTFSFEARKLGITVKGEMVVVKSEKYVVWTVWNNSLVFTSLRMDAKPAGDQTKFDFRMDLEVPQAGRIPGMESWSDDALKIMLTNIDAALAGIQAHFDPSLDTASLLSKGFRGEIYDSLIQAYEAKIRISVPSQKIVEWLSNEATLGRFLADFNVEEQYVKEMTKAPLGTITYAPGAYNMGLVKFKMDIFAVSSQQNKDNIMKLYAVMMGRVGYIEMRVIPEGKTSIVSMKYFSEMQGNTDTSVMELLVLPTLVPDILKGKLKFLKKEIESAGLTIR